MEKNKHLSSGSFANNGKKDLSFEPEPHGEVLPSPPSIDYQPSSFLNQTVHQPTSFISKG